MDTPIECPFAKRVSERVRDRASVGFKKYGVTCARTDLSAVEWLRHLQEELLDAAVYTDDLRSIPTQTVVAPPSRNAHNL